MTMFPQVQQHPASVDAYIRHGWSLVPIPPGTKGPETKGWNQRVNCLKDHTQLPPGWGIGLAHAYSGTMAVDVDVWDRAAFELMLHGINLQALYDAPDAVIVDSGRQGHGKLLYAMPFGLALPSKKLIDQYPDGKRYNYLDLRCGTANGMTVQDVLPPSIHPDTKQPYRWAGHGHWMRLPTIPMPLLNYWQALLEKDQAKNIEAGGVTASWDEIRSILDVLNPDCSRDEWITVGMALHYAGSATGELNQALYLWNEWSAKSQSKYPGEKAMLIQWNSFRSDKGNSVKLGSLYRMASQVGWTKPVPDASELFSQVEVKAPPQVTMELKPQPPELEFSLMPDVVRQVAIDISSSVGCDPLVPLFAALSAISGAVDARTRLELRPGFKVPPVLWVMTIGDPADKKTPGSKPLFDILKVLEHEDKPRFKQAMQVFEALEARYEAARKSFLDAAKDPEHLLTGDIPAGYGDAPVPPTPLRTVVQDVTSQKLVRIAADNPRGVLCYLDEMNSWASKLTDPRSIEMVSAWTTAYESTYYKMDRVGAGEFEAENYAVSIYGNIQPRVLETHVHKLSEDGLIQRFIPVTLRGNMTRLGSPSRDKLVSLAAFEMSVRQVFGLPAMTYSLTQDAETRFVEFQKWYHSRLRDERLLKSSDLYMQAFGKVEGLTGRLILLFHLILDPYSLQVKLETVNRAIQMVMDYIVPSMRYVYNSGMTGAESFDLWMMEYVIQYADQGTLTLTDIRRGARRQIEKLSKQTQIDSVVSSMHVLERAGWVIRLDDGSQEYRGHGQWSINPALLEQFSDHRKQVIEAKQRMMDHVYRDAVKRKPRVHGIDEFDVDDSKVA